MNNNLGSMADEFYVSIRLYLKLEMEQSPETVLQFFDRLRRKYPLMTKMRRREADSLVLEESAEESTSRRWVRIEPDSLRFGHYMPTDLDDVREFGEFILSQAPYYLTFSEINYDHMELVYGFDLDYRGNHDQLVAETLYGDLPEGNFLVGGEGAHIIDAQPYWGIALTPDCDLQAYLEVKSRTSTYEVRSGHFDPQPISVYLTLRKYWGVNPPESPGGAMTMLFDEADQLATDRIVPTFVNPLAAAIASRS